MASRGYALPNIQDLSKDQERARLRPREGCHLVVGGPGTGKSIIALLRTRRHHRDGGPQDYVFLVYNHLLLEASRELVSGNVNAHPWIAWFKSVFRRALGRSCPVVDGKAYQLDWAAIADLIAGADANELKTPATPFLIVDEGQDMPPSFYQALAELGFEHFYVVADQNQQITDEHSNIRDIENALDIQPGDRIELTDNYRNCDRVARLALALCIEDLASPCAKLPKGRPCAGVPVLVDYGPNCRWSFETVIERILKLADRNPEKLIGVIAPDNHTREHWLQRLREQPVALDHARPRIVTYPAGDPGSDYRFSEGGIFVINAQSAKGLEFDIVMLADINRYRCHPENPGHLDDVKRRFYVMDSRGQMRELNFPGELAGDEQLLLVPAPLPASWIRAILFASKEERAAIRDEAADYGNVPLNAYKQLIKAKLLTGVAKGFLPPPDGVLPDRDAPSHRASAVGAAMALLFELGNRGGTVVDAGRLIDDTLDPSPETTPDSAGDPLLRALYLWVRSEPHGDSDEVQTRMLLQILNAIVDAKAQADSASDEDYCPADIQQVVLDVLESQKTHFAEPKWQEALNRLTSDLRGILGLGGDTLSEILQRHPRSFSRGLILFFLRQQCDELLTFKQPLLTARDLMVAAVLFAARSGWMSIPAELRQTKGLGEAILHRMAALDQRDWNTGLDLGPSPSRPRPLRELLTTADGAWSKRQRDGALALARGMRWSQLLETRISLGKGDYRLQVDGRGVHLLMDGDVKAVITDVDQAGLFALLAESTVPGRVDADVRAVLKG